MSTTLITEVSTTVTYPVYRSITASNCCGVVSLILSSFTEQMAYEVPAINIDIYHTVNDVRCLYRSRALTIFTNKINKSESYVLMDIPQECELAITPIFDKNAIQSHNKMLEVFNTNNKWKTTRGNIPDEEYNANDGYIEEIKEGNVWTSDTTFNITLTWDDINIKAGGGGGSSPTPEPIPVDVPTTIYYGAVNAPTVTDLTEVSSANLTNVTVNVLITEADNQYIVFLYPAKYKDLVGLKDENGFGQLYSFTQTTTTIEGETYKLYVSETPITTTQYTYQLIFN